MQVSITSNDTPAKTAVLSDNASLQPLDDLRLTNAGEKQNGRFLRGRSQKCFDRQNDGTTLVFTTLRTFDDFGKADAFILQHYGSIPHSGTVKCLANDGSSSKTIPDAVLKPVVHQQIGVSVLTTYTIEGGLIV